MTDIEINCLIAIGAISGLAWLYRRAKSAKTGDVPAKLETALATDSAITAKPANDDDIVVIATAVYAMLGAIRIVHIDDLATGRRWAAEGRWMHQTSHRTH